jgi:geranylgeranyl transferase type-2 subunit beta
VSWINCEKLGHFIMQCQDADDGGISDRPGNMADIFHTFFGISGLSLLGFFSQSDATAGGSIPMSRSAERAALMGSTSYEGYREIDPTYALPKDLVQKLGLQRQSLEKV